MLKNLRKEFNKIIGKEETMNQPTQEPQAAVVQEVAQMAVDAQAFAEQGEQLAAALASLQEVKSQLEAAVAEKAALLAKITDEKNQARMSAITKAVGDKKAQAVFDATKALADTEFQAIVSAMAGSYEAEANTDLFKEVGAQAEVDPQKVPAEESKEMQLLREKYQAKK
jgi:hypothetical protein